MKKLPMQRLQNKLSNGIDKLTPTQKKMLLGTALAAAVVLGMATTIALLLMPEFCGNEPNSAKCDIASITGVGGLVIVSMLITFALTCLGFAACEKINQCEEERIKLKMFNKTDSSDDQTSLNTSSKTYGAAGNNV